MSAASSQLAVRDAILKGIEKAYGRYDRIAGDSLEHAPEYFVTVQIAEALSKGAQPCSVTLESNVKRILGEAGAKKAGRHKSVARIRGRFDIVLWYGHTDQPRAIVEVKHPLSVAVEGRINSDVERICWLLAQSREVGGSLRIGYFAFFSFARPPKQGDANASARIKRRLQTITSHCKSIAKKYGCSAVLRSGPIHRIGDEDKAWAANTMVFRSR